MEEKEIQLFKCPDFFTNIKKKNRCTDLDREIQLSKCHTFDHIGGFLRARVTIDVASPLRRWVLIESARRKSMDLYEVQYEQIPHFCFSCGRLGHPDILCPTPGNRDNNGDLPFGKGLRASDEWKKPVFSEGSSGGQGASYFNKPETKNSSNAAEKGPEATSPLKKNSQVKRKAASTNLVYRRVETPLLDSVADGAKAMVVFKDPAENLIDGATENVVEEGRDPRRRNPHRRARQIRQRLQGSPARRNDLPGMEQPGAWEPCGCSRASQCREAGRS
jgi:hypothetical protein